MWGAYVVAVLSGGMYPKERLALEVSRTAHEQTVFSSRIGDTPGFVSSNGVAARTAGGMRGFRA